MRRHDRRAFLCQPQRARRTGVSKVASQNVERASFRALSARTFVFLFARWWLYLCLTAATLALECAIYFIWRNDIALEIVVSIFPPILTAAAYALTGHDAGMDFAPFARVLQRFWLVIVVDFLVSTVIGLALFDYGIPDVLMGTLMLALGISLIYADVFVVLCDEPDGLLFLRSMRQSAIVAWSGLDNIGRTISIVALQLVPLLVSQKLQILIAARHVSSAAFWADAPLGTIIVPVLSVLTALVYIDATGRPTTHVCGK